MYQKLTPKRRAALLAEIKQAKIANGERPIVYDEEILELALEQDRYGPKPVKVARTLYGVQITSQLKKKLLEAMKRQKDARMTAVIDRLLDHALALDVANLLPVVADDIKTPIGLYLRPDHLKKIQQLLNDNGFKRGTLIERLLTTALDQQK